MAQHDYVINNQSGAAFRADLNNALAAIVSNNSGVSEPSTTYPYMPWADTTNGLYKIRNAANTGWITLYQLDGEWTSIALENGAVGTPSLYFKDSGVDTGIYSPGTDQVAIATAGVQRVNFNAATEVVFNDGGADVDFRVEGDTNANLFKIDAGTDQVQVANLNGGPLAGFRNAIINGDFDIWQRGTSFTASEYGADRWLHGRLGTTHTASRQAFALGQTDVPNEPTYFCRTIVSSVAASGNFSALIQRIEGVRSFAGQQVTVSFWAKADASKNISVDFLQYFGTGGSPSSDVSAIGATKIAIGTTWQKITITATIPSISGKTIGTNNNDALDFYIWFDASSVDNARTVSLGHQSGTFDIAQVQIERGPVATPFERRGFGQELALCQRYYEIGQFMLNTSVSTGGITTGTTLNYATRKRASSPIVTLSSIVYNNNSNALVQQSYPNGFVVTSQSSGGPGASILMASWTSSAEL